MLAKLCIAAVSQLGTHLRGKRKREEMAQTIQKQRKAAQAHAAK